MIAATGSLDLLPRDSEAFAERCLALARTSSRGVILHPWTDAMRSLRARLARDVPGVRCCAHFGEADAHGGLDGLSWESADTVILDSAPGDLPSHLLQLVDFPGLRVLAPRTTDYYLNRPLFLVSIPKAGTHILNRLVEKMGYGARILQEEFPLPGKWYCLEYTNSHTVARDFFVDTVRRAPFGNRHHAFASSPALFIYRHPLDVLVSEANYYHLEGKTAFAQYLSSLTFEQRVHRLLDDPWLLRSIRDRIGGFSPWLEFPNVIPLSFEELVGERGGGSREEQVGLIWSLQLKLQVPGEPRAYANSVFDADSPTFYQGRIGAWRSLLSEKHLARFGALNQDFMEAFGYSLEEVPFALPRRRAEFRGRPLLVAPPPDEGVPIALEYNYLDFNLVRYGGWIYAVPQAAGPGLDLRRLPVQRLTSLPRERNLSSLKHRLLIRSLMWGGSTELMAYHIVTRLSGAGHWGGAVAALLRTAARAALNIARRYSRAQRKPGS